MPSNPAPAGSATPADLCAHLRKVAAGKTLTEIGKILSLSIKTISTYRSRILHKMQLDNNSELTRYALKHGLVD